MPTQRFRVVRRDRYAERYRLAQAHKLIRLFEAGDDLDNLESPIQPDDVDFAAVRRDEII